MSTNFDREYPIRPVVAVGAVILSDDKILLVKRKNPPGQGLWTIPGGVVELGETLKDALKREVREETGLEIEVIKPIEIVDEIVRDENEKIRFHYVIIDFLAKPAGGELRASSDVLDAKWIKFGEIENYKISKTLKRILGKLCGSSFLK